MKELLERLRAESPIFFKKIRTISLAIATASTGAALFYTQLSPTLQSYIPVNLLKYFIVAGTVAAFVANLTKVDSTNTTTK